MTDITMGLALLLGAGFVAAKLGQMLRLPSVTGYICAGFLLGPSCFNLITHESIANRLDHFTQIALMLIAFGIGEHIEIKKLKKTFRTVGAIAMAEICASFVLVGLGCLLAMSWAGAGTLHLGDHEQLALALLLGAIAIATAPATILHVTREMKASGPLTTALLQVVAVNDGLTIVIFGMAATAARILLGSQSSSLLGGTISGLHEVLLSLLLGVITGLAIDWVNSRLRRREEMLTAGLALLLLCGEGARLLYLSPLLAGMAAGLTIVSRDARDVRIFRVLNAFEAPVYVLFFTLAGAHLDTATLSGVGWVGLAYFLLRAVGKIIGANLGARIAKTQKNMRLIGPALLPQAGIAIGLSMLLQSDPELASLAIVITPVVLGSVFLAELLGPICVRMAVVKAGEIPEPVPEKSAASNNGATGLKIEKMELVPWSWERLKPAIKPNGVVIFGAANVSTIAGLARMATLFAHYHEATPLAVHVLCPAVEDVSNPKGLFTVAKNEVEKLGYKLQTEIVAAENVATGILKAASSRKSCGIFLGHQMQGTVQEFEKVVGKVTQQATCPVVVIRFAGVLHTEKILVPIVSRKSLEVVRGLIRSLCGAGRHRITLLYLLPCGASDSEMDLTEKKIQVWSRLEGLASQVEGLVKVTESRLGTILEESENHDLLIMAAGQQPRLQRLFFGCLAENVAQHCHKPMLMVYQPPR